MRTEQLIDNYPVLYHMAEQDSWPLIRGHGLLSTSALLDLFAYEGIQRRQIEEAHRPQSIEIASAKLGHAVVRDQKPMSDAALVKCLKDGLTPRDWYKILNSKAFFWVSTNRLNRLLNAGPYRNRGHDVLVLDTASVVRAYGDKIYLSPMNSGCTKPFPHPRGLETFSLIPDYPLEHWRAKRPLWDSVVEVAVEGGLTDIERFVLRVESRIGDRLIRKIWEK